MSFKKYDNQSWIGLKKEKTVLNVSYDKIASILNSQQNIQKSYEPELIIGVSRGGIVPATMVATNLSLPLLLISVTRGVEIVSWLSEPKTEILETLKQRKIKILLIDDIISSGQTILKTKYFLENMGFIVFLNVVFYDEKSSVVPEIGTSIDRYIKFPWEKKENTFGSIKAKEKKCVSNFHFTDETDSFGFDLDGIFAKDISQDLYDNNLEQALKYRDQLKLMPNSPKIPHHLRPHTAIITARPMLDYERTRVWLDNNHFGDIMLHCRDQIKFEHKLQGHIESKIQLINDLGISCYFESDLTQAVSISKEIPSIDVVWWNEGNPILINAHDFKINFSIYQK